MIRMGKESNLAASKVIERAIGFFGPSGLGMTVQEQSDCCARFEGAGGEVFVQAVDTHQKGSDVTIEGREWEYQIRQFMGEI